MGDPKFSRRKYDTPNHPWEAERMAEESELLKKYGLKNKRELWKAKSEIKRYRQRSRKLQAKTRYSDPNSVRESKELLDKLQRQGMLPREATLDDVLSMGVEDVLSRRLQHIIYSKGLASTEKQARQFIVHGHISVKGQKLTIPGYIVKADEEDQIDYSTNTPLNSDMHPARPRDDPLPVPEAEKEEKEEPKEEASEEELKEEAEKPKGEAVEEAPKEDKKEAAE